MSRTIGHTRRNHKTSRGGLDMWSRRLGGHQAFSKYARKLTARIERQKDRLRCWRARRDDE